MNVLDRHRNGSAAVIAAVELGHHDLTTLYRRCVLFCINDARYFQGLVRLAGRVDREKIPNVRQDFWRAELTQMYLLHRFFVPGGGTSAIESARWEGNLFWLVLLSISAYIRASVVLTDDVSVEL